MTWTLQNISNYGTSTPAVARTAVQGKDIVQFLGGTDVQKAQAIEALFALQKRLIRCVSIHEGIDALVRKAGEDLKSGKLNFQPDDRVVRPPSIPDLEGVAESFLQGAKLAISAATRLTEPFYGEHFGHKLNKLEAWAEKKFGQEHAYVGFAKGWQPWVKEILALRDAIDHPRKGPGGTLHIQNFTVEFRPNEAALLAPMWWLEGSPRIFIADSMAHIIEGVIRLQEDLLGSMFHVRKQFPFAVLEEIPPDKRDPQCPIRLRVGLNAEMTKKLSEADDRP